jgi:hypothetical protein
MSRTAGMREKPVFNVILDWHVIPTRRSWLVYDGGELIRDVEFAREEDAIAFAREKADESNASEPDPNKHRKVVISTREMFKTVVEDGVERFVTVPGEPPPRRGFGSMEGRVWMSPDFDDPLPEFEEDDE